MRKKTRELVHVWHRPHETSKDEKNENRILSDVLGSYTGTPIGRDPDEKPVQDADDL